MKFRTFTSVSALALIMAAGPAMAQSARDEQRPPQQSQPTQPRDVMKNPQPSQPSPQTNAQPQTPSDQQTAQQPQNQRNLQRPARNAQQPPSNRNTAQQPAQPNRNAQQQTPSTNRAAQPRRNAQQSPNSAQQPQRNAQQPNTPSTNQAQRPQSTRVNVSLNVQQRTRVSQAIAKLNVRPLSNVRFSVAVGTAVPASVHVQRLPASVVSVVPQYRGYDFVVVSNRIVIIEPRSRQIVAFMPYEASPVRAQAPRPQHRSVWISEPQRHVIREALPRERSTTGTRGYTRVIVGEEIPETVELHSFPDVVYERVPEIRHYRYYSDDSGIIVVDPGERRVIDVLE